MVCPNCHSNWNRELICSCGHRWEIDEVDDVRHYVIMRRDEFEPTFKTMIDEATTKFELCRRLYLSDRDGYMRYEQYRLLARHLKGLVDGDRVMSRWLDHDAPVDNTSLMEIVEMIKSGIKIEPMRPLGIDDQTVKIIHSFVEWLIGSFDVLDEYSDEQLRVARSVRDGYLSMFMRPYILTDYKYNWKEINRHLSDTVFADLISTPSYRRIVTADLDRLYWSIISWETQHRWVTIIERQSVTFDDIYRWICISDDIEQALHQQSYHTRLMLNWLYEFGYIGHGPLIMSETILQKRKELNATTSQDIGIRVDGEFVYYVGQPGTEFRIMNVGYYSIH